MRYHWTNHSKYKMRFYRLSEQMVRGVMHRPKRVEEGIAPDTVAYMKQAGSKKHPHEIWVMTSKERGTPRIISAWRYPGITKPGAALPAAIKAEIEEAL
jgi:hypothetical protein